MKKLFLDDIRTIEMVYDKSEVGTFDIVRTPILLVLIMIWDWMNLV